MSDIRKSRQEEETELYRELYTYALVGIRLWLNGVRSTPAEIAGICCASEGKNYMRDYIQDSMDQVTDIAFDAIDDEE